MFQSGELKPLKPEETSKLKPVVEKFESGIAKLKKEGSQMESSMAGSWEHVKAE